MSRRRNVPKRCSTCLASSVYAEEALKGDAAGGGTRPSWRLFTSAHVREDADKPVHHHSGDSQIQNL